MREIDNILNKTVSIQPNAWSSLNGEFAIKDILEWIKLGKYQTDIAKLRTYLNEGGIDKYDMHKKRLPAVTFCGTFEASRKKECLKEYNYLLVIDMKSLSLL